MTIEEREAGANHLVQKIEDDYGLNFSIVVKKHIIDGVEFTSEPILLFKPVEGWKDEPNDPDYQDDFSGQPPAPTLNKSTSAS